MQITQHANCFDSVIAESDENVIDNGQGIKCYPCQSIHLSIRHAQRRLLSTSNTFDQNFKKLGHIV